jgi:hypothetical protein
MSNVSRASNISVLEVLLPQTFPNPKYPACVLKIAVRTKQTIAMIPDT